MDTETNQTIETNQHTIQLKILKKFSDHWMNIWHVQRQPAGSGQACEKHWRRYHRGERKIKIILP